MPLKTYKATSPVRRFRQSASFAEITKTKPARSLIASKRRQAGRNAQGKVTTRPRGGGEKRNYRIIDFKRDKDGIPATVRSIEYDPNRTANIALIHYADGEKRYILAPRGLGPGDEIVSGPGSDPRVGNALPLGEIPLGSAVHAVELKPGKGAQAVRSAGAPTPPVPAAPAAGSPGAGPFASPVRYK